MKRLCVLGVVGLALIACAVEPTTNEQVRLGTTKQAISIALTIDFGPLSDPPGQQLAVIRGLPVQTTGFASFSAEPGTYSVGGFFPGFDLGTFEVGDTGITATTGVLVASTPTALTVDPTRLAQVRIPLSQHVDPPNPFLFTGRFNVPIHNPPFFGGPFSARDVRFTLPDGHYVISNGWFGLPPFNWGSFDVVNHQLASAGEGFTIVNGELAVDRCAFASVNINALPPPMGFAFQIPGIFQSPLPAFGGTFYLPRGFDYTVAPHGAPGASASFTIPATGPITNVVNQPFLQPITDGPTGSCVPPPPPPPPPPPGPTVSCAGAPLTPLIFPSGPQCSFHFGPGGLILGGCGGTAVSCTWNGSEAGVDVFPTSPSAPPTPVMVTATSATGETASCTSWFKVIDDMPPAVHVSVSPTTLKADKKMHQITISKFSFDQCGAPPVNCIAYSPDASPDDIQWIDGELYVRAEKNQHQGHAARVYTIECSASDTAATTTTTATVTVPHDNSGH
jgi:hypothetical protein